MGYSGTVSLTVFSNRKIIDHAYRRCRIPSALITAEYIEIAKDQLYLLLSNMANEKIPLWCVEKQLYPLYEGMGGVTLDVGTVDILNANLRTLSEVDGSVTTAVDRWTLAAYAETTVTTVGIFWSGASSPYAIEYSADNVTWVTAQTQANPEAVSGEWTWVDLTTVLSASYFRVRATTGDLNTSVVYFGYNPSEIPLYRMNQDDYTNLPNKVFQSNRPLQYWLDHQLPQKIMRMWPIPNAQAETSQLVVWRQRQVMDVGSMTDELEVPQRWYDAVVGGLAAKLSLEIPEVDTQLIPILRSEARDALALAWAQERDNSPTYIAPNISMYTR